MYIYIYSTYLCIGVLFWFLLEYIYIYIHEFHAAGTCGNGRSSHACIHARKKAYYYPNIYIYTHACIHASMQGSIQHGPCAALMLSLQAVSTTATSRQTHWLQAAKVSTPSTVVLMATQPMVSLADVAWMAPFVEGGMGPLADKTICKYRHCGSNRRSEWILFRGTEGANKSRDIGFLRLTTKNLGLEFGGVCHVCQSA